MRTLFNVHVVPTPQFVLVKPSVPVVKLTASRQTLYAPSNGLHYKTDVPNLVNLAYLGSRCSVRTTSQSSDNKIRVGGV